MTSTEGLAATCAAAFVLPNLANWNWKPVSFLVKEGTNNKTLGIIVFACSREVGNSLFRCSKPKDMGVMSTICLRHIEVNVRNQFFFTCFAFVCNEEG